MKKSLIALPQGVFVFGRLFSDGVSRSCITKLIDTGWWYSQLCMFENKVTIGKLRTDIQLYFINNIDLSVLLHALWHVTDIIFVWRDMWRKWSRVPELVSLGDFSQFFEGSLKCRCLRENKTWGKRWNFGNNGSFKKNSNTTHYTTSF